MRKHDLAHCELCPLASRPCVPSAIVPEAELMIVGEAPGTQEVINKRPFSGPTGAVLNQALKHVGIDPRRVARTNAVLCRPYGDEDTPEAAIMACAPRLAAEIAESGARRVVAAGGAALAALDLLAGRRNMPGVMARSGRVYSLDNDRDYIATVNPAFLFRSDSYTPTYLRHLRRASSPARVEFDPDRVRYVVASEANFDQLIAYVESFAAGAPLAFDVETRDLQWYTTPARDAADLLCLVLTLEDWRSIIIPADFLTDNGAVRRIVLGWLRRFNVVGHNVKFDQNVSARPSPLGLGEFFEAYDDTMLMHYALQELGAHGLKELAADYLGAPDYEEELVISWFKANGMSRDDLRDYSALPKERLYKYAAIDGACTLQLWRIFDAELKRQGIYDRPYRETYIDALANAVPLIEQEGIVIDRAQVATARVIFEHDLTELTEAMTAEIAPLLGTPADRSGGELARLMAKREKVEGVFVPKKDGKPSKRQATREVMVYNPASNQQTSHILYNLLGLKLTKRLIKPTSTNTGKEALEALPPHSFVTKLRKFRRVDKMLDTYIASIERRATLADTIHVDFRITGTEIGRLSASNGDHGIPRPDDFYGAMIRSLFVAGTDEVLIIADYSQAELRAFALLARVKFLLDKYAAGLDVHGETALMLEKLGAPLFRHYAEYKAIVKDEEARGIKDTPTAHAVKAIRTVAKNINFGNIYQGGAEGIAGMLGGRVPVEAIREVLAVYRELMPEAFTYAESQFALLRRQAYVETVFGRRRRFYILTDENEDEARKSVVHMVVAGSAADLTNHSAARLRRDGVRVCHTVHDSILARARRDEAPAIARHMAETMIGVGNEFMPGVPWLADVDVSDRWVPTPELPDWYQNGRQPA